jgi:hypothetical protein
MSTIIIPLEKKFNPFGQSQPRTLPLVLDDWGRKIARLPIEFVEDIFCD